MTILLIMGKYILRAIFVQISPVVFDCVSICVDALTWFYEDIFVQFITIFFPGKTTILFIESGHVRVKIKFPVFTTNFPVFCSTQVASITFTNSPHKPLIIDRRDKLSLYLI